MAFKQTSASTCAQVTSVWALCFRPQSSCDLMWKWPLRQYAIATCLSLYLRIIRSFDLHIWVYSVYVNYKCLKVSWNVFFIAFYRRQTGVWEEGCGLWSKAFDFQSLILEMEIKIYFSSCPDMVVYFYSLPLIQLKRKFCWTQPFSTFKIIYHS